MTVAIIITDKAAPAILERDNDQQLFEAISELAVTPDDARESEDACRAWVESLDPPSGWFENAEAAKVYQQRIQRERDSNLLKGAQKKLGVTQVGLTAALGLSDPRKDGSPVRKIMGAKNAMGGTARRSLAYALKYGPMTPEEEAELLMSVDEGSWHQVDRKKLRRA